MADGKIQTPFSEITSPGGLKCQDFGGRRGFEERQERKTEQTAAETPRRARNPFAKLRPFLGMEPVKL